MVVFAVSVDQWQGEGTGQPSVKLPLGTRFGPAPADDTPKITAAATTAATTVVRTTATIAPPSMRACRVSQAPGGRSNAVAGSVVGGMPPGLIRSRYSRKAVVGPLRGHPT